MKLIHSALLIFSFSIIFCSCDKDDDLSEDPAFGSMVKDSTGDCMPIAISGIYKAGRSLSANNFITVRADFTATGLYDMRSDTINGYYFLSADRILIGGVNTIRMQGYGTPQAAGTDVLRIKLNGSQCEANIIVQ